MKNAKIFTLVLFVLLAVAGVAYALEESSMDYSVDVFVYGKQIDFPDQKPFIDTSVNRTYVPVRFVSQALGAIVGWDENDKTVTIQKPNLSVLLKIDSDQATTVAGEVYKTIQLDAPAILVNERTMVPLRFVSEALGAKVNWTPAPAGGGHSRVDLEQ
ncbi:MAG: copper amine oxidase N-terminal domain-containing protein [Firmicutes bacterium]|nr:copper amine oxidase N-terminal domain-containing protein [Bacillota bacterium]